MGRFFSKSQKRIIASQSESIDGPVHFDHVVPWSKGGPTDVVNGQMLSAEENLKKGNKMGLWNGPEWPDGFRKWQRQFVSAWPDMSHRPALLTAVPGSGKTIPALKIAADWIDGSPRNRKLVVVVPTVHMKRQWRDVAKRCGLDFKAYGFDDKSQAIWPPDYHGFAVTYSHMGKSPDWFERLIGGTGKDVMVILDEVHHCGDEADWGESMRIATGRASLRLLLSGTPFRTDGTRIPFVNYDASGYSVSDFRYSYAEASADEVIRTMHFVWETGKVNGFLGAEYKQLVLNEDTPEAVSQVILSKILFSEGKEPEFVIETIKKCDAQLSQLRQRDGNENAGALALCMTHNHAHAVAQLIERATGERPSLVVSNEEISNDDIPNFRDSKKRWVVAIKKLSEGVDVPRLQCLCYFTNTVTDMFFEQAVGRVIRRCGENDYDAYIYIPSDPRLMACAKRMWDEQKCALKSNEEIERMVSEVLERKQKEFFVPHTTEYDGTAYVLTHGKEYDSKEHDFIGRLSTRLKCSFEDALECFHMVREYGSTSAVAEPLERHEKSLDEQKEEVIGHIGYLVGQVKSKYEIEFEYIHGVFKGHFGKPQRRLTLDELREKLEMLQDWYATGRFNECD